MNDAVDKMKSVPKRRIRKIRRLLRREPEPVKKSHKNKIVAGILIAIMACLMITFVWRNEEFREHVKRLSMNQFQLYLHGKFDSFLTEKLIPILYACHSNRTFVSNGYRS